MARWLGLALLLALAPPAAGHDFTVTAAEVVMSRDGDFRVRMTCDLDALALGAAPDADSARLAAALAALPPPELEERLERLRRLFERRVRVRFDGEPAQFVVRFVQRGTPAASAGGIPSYLGTVVELSGEVPAGAERFTFFASRAFPPVRLKVGAAGGDAGEAAALVLQRGEESPPLAVGEAMATPSRLRVAGRYLALGFWHIVPEGLDHILFVLGLFLLSPRLRPLLWQVSAFTVAHTLTLALSTHGVVSLPSRPVEALIALSIAYVAVENLLTRELRPWRVGVVFAFGLLHGLGFAGVLAELGVPAGESLTALLSFNVGVELGQLAVIAAALAAVGWWRHRDGYRRWVVLPASLAIAAVGLLWTVERALG